jgi:hypothetical protein
MPSHGVAEHRREKTESSVFVAEEIFFSLSPLRAFARRA